MREILRCCILISFLIFFFSTSDKACAAEGALPLTADAAVLIDYQTGTVLYGSNATRPLPPASTTKILASLLSLEIGDGKDTVIIDKYTASVEGTSIYLKSGQILSLRDLTKGALINSGNDAATAIAIHLAGNEQQFASLMNYKAKTVGCWQSRYYNPHGLPQVGHAVSAYDMARITRYALKNKNFRCIVSTRSDRIRDASGKVIKLYNTNRLLGHRERGIEVVGVKTGTTSEAGECLVAAANVKGQLLISVVLGSSNRYADTLRLFEFGAKECHSVQIRRKTPCFQVPVWRGSQSEVAVGPEEDISVVVPTNQLPLLEKRVYLKPYLRAPCAKGSRVGRMEIVLGNNLLYSTELITLQDISKRCFSIKKGFR